jgi:hypothetical protein
MPKRRLDIERINETLLKVEKKWPEIDAALEKAKVGRRDTPFDPVIRERMITAYIYINQLLEKKIKPLSLESLTNILELNNLVHYGCDFELRLEHNKSILTTRDKFYKQIDVLKKWYEKHEDEPSMKLAAEMYIGIVGYPQLFVEGNHRTGSLVASWINIYHGKAPFVLTPDNAVGYFAPSHAIKYFTDKTTWRGRFKLPKYRKAFRKFLEDNVDDKYLIKTK